MMPDPSGFHFAQALWLWALILPLLLWLMPLSRRRAQRSAEERLRAYADPALLPHLLVRAETDKDSERKRLWAWSLLWWLGVLALAGPRWNYTDIEVFQPGSDLVILFDLSRSMEANDVKPSRLARARQEVEDLLRVNQGIRVGLIAFATVAHVVAPITEDTQTLRHLMPSLSPSLIQLQGSRLSNALERAETLFSGQPSGNSRALLLISDGDFAEPGLEQKIHDLKQKGVHFYVLGVGTPQGGGVPGQQGGWMSDARGQRVVSHLDETGLKALAASGDGFYQRADYRDDDTKALLARIQQDAPPKLESNPVRVWHERFYLLLIPMLFLLLSRFRRGESAAWRPSVK